MARFSFKKTEKEFEVLDKKTGEKWKLPLKFEDLKEFQKKNIKNSLILSKIIAIFLPGLFLLSYQMYSYLLWYIALSIGFNFLGDNAAPLYTLLHLVLVVLILWKWGTTWYEGKSYYILKSAYLAKEKIK